MSLDYPPAVLRPPFRRAYRLPFRSPAGIETIIANALADINADDAVGIASVSEIPNSGLGGTGFDYDTPLGTPANGKPHPSGSVVLFGGNGDFISTPDSASAHITTDIEFIAKIAPDDNTPSSVVEIISKWAASPGFNYIFRLNVNGTLVVFGSDAGTSALSFGPSTVDVGKNNGSTYWVKASIDVNDGSGNRVAKYYTSDDPTDDPTAVVWVQLGTTITTSGTTTIRNGPIQIEVGSQAGGIAALFKGPIYRAQILNGIDGPVVADMNPADQTNASDLTWTSLSTGEVWTLNGNTFAQNTGHKALDSIGSYGLETPSGQDIAVFTRFIVGRFTTAAPGADQVIFDARSNALKSVSLFSDFSNSNKLTLDAGGTPIAIAGAYDNDFHVFTVISNGANSLLRVSGVGEITGNPGGETLDYGTILANLSTGNSAPFSYLRDLTFNSALSGARIAQIEDAFAQTYKGVAV